MLFRSRIGQTRWSRHIQARRLERETVARVCASLVREIPLSTCGAHRLCCRCCRGRVLAVGAQLAGPRAIHILVFSRRTRHTGATAGPRGVAAITRAVALVYTPRWRVGICNARHTAVDPVSVEAGIARAKRLQYAPVRRISMCGTCCTGSGSNLWGIFAVLTCHAWQPTNIDLECACWTSLAPLGRACHARSTQLQRTICACPRCITYTRS